MGSFPFQFNWSDFLKVAKDVGLVAATAAVGYILNTVIPGISTDNLYVLAVLPFVTAILSGVLKYLTDTRDPVEKARLPYSEYKALPKEEKRREKLRLTIK